MPLTELVPFDPRVAHGARSATYVSGNIALHATQVPIQRAGGWFGIYDAKVFALLNAPDESALLVHIDGVTIPVSKISNCSHQASLSCRTLSFDFESRRVSFSYQRLFHRFASNPLDAISRIIFADDWWGVTCDLPAWFSDNIHWLSSKNPTDRFLADVRRDLASPG